MTELEERSWAIWRNARDKGFYSKIDELLSSDALRPDQKEFIRTIWMSNRLMLIVSELAEALEGLRHGNFSSDPKSGGVGEELADAQIRLLDLCRDIAYRDNPDFNLEDAVDSKMKYNSGREKMHGGKRI